MEKITQRGASSLELFTIPVPSIELESFHPSGVIQNFEMVSGFSENFCTPALNPLGFARPFHCDILSQSLHAVILLENKFTQMFG